jgi:hypothetical protein
LLIITEWVNISVMVSPLEIGYGLLSYGCVTLVKSCLFNCLNAYTYESYWISLFFTKLWISYSWVFAPMFTERDIVANRDGEIPS